jgi:hypothetical protein
VTVEGSLIDGYLVQMSGPRSARSAVGDMMRRLATLAVPPRCALCGRGQASTGWIVDPFGRVGGLCHGCVEGSPAARPDDPPAGNFKP